MCGTPGVSPTHPAVNPTLQTSPSMITQQTVCDWLHTLDQPAYSSGLTPINYCLFRNLKSCLRGVHYTWQCMSRGCLHWCCKSFPFHGLWRHELQWHHIRNKLIRVHRECTFYSYIYIYCEIFFSLIHWFSVLIERRSYFADSDDLYDFSIYNCNCHYLR